MAPGVMPSTQLGLTVGVSIAIMIPCIGYVLFNLRTLKIFSKIYNTENRDISDRRPVDRDIKTHIPKLYWISGIVWGAMLIILAGVYLYMTSSYDAMQGDSYSMRQARTILNVVASLTGTLAIWVVVDLLSTRFYLKKYAVQEHNEIDSIGTEIE
jgi:hypothetical protein